MYSGVQHVFTIWVTWRVSYGRKELLTLRKHLSQHFLVGSVRVAHQLFLFDFLSCALFISILCVQYGQGLWIVNSSFPLWFSLTFIFYYNKCEHRNVLSKRQVWMSILIGYYTVVCTIWKDIVRVCIVLKTRIGRDAAGIESNTGFQYNTDEYNIFPYCTYHCIINYLLYSWNDQYYVMFNF